MRSASPSCMHLPRGATSCFACQADLGLYESSKPSRKIQSTNKDLSATDGHDSTELVEVRWTQIKNSSLIRVHLCSSVAKKSEFRISCLLITPPRSANIPAPHRSSKLPERGGDDRRRWRPRLRHPSRAERKTAPPAYRGGRGPDDPSDPSPDRPAQTSSNARSATANRSRSAFPFHRRAPRRRAKVENRGSRAEDRRRLSPRSSTLDRRPSTLAPPPAT